MMNPAIPAAIAANNAALAASRHHGHGPSTPEEAGAMLLVCGAVILYMFWIMWLGIGAYDDLRVLVLGIIAPFLGFGFLLIGWTVVGALILGALILGLCFLSYAAVSQDFPRL